MPNSRAKAACFALILIIGLVSPLFAAQDCDPWAARLVSVEGRVEVRGDGGEPWQPVSIGQAFCFGDQLRVGANSRASVELNNDTILRLDQNSTLIIPEAARTGFTFLDLIKGALHLISRVKGALEIRTPFVNAGLEGTEFVVRVLEKETLVSVIEGEVKVSNAFGSLRLSGGETASGTKTSAPVLRLDLTPEDAVQWAIYYPVITGPGAVNVAAEILEAQELLRVGRSDEALRAIDRVIDRDPENSDALALASIIELAQNRRSEALKLASRAVEADASAAALTALSFVQQAGFDLPAALATIEAATQEFPEQALLWARLAEVQSSLGRRAEALASAQRAVELNPDLSRTQTVLGFSYLARSRTDDALATFEQAIRLDSADPLPRLGIGLAKIRQGQLVDGRREMEIAVSLDPSNALVRSYLGKAYFEEDRSTEAGTEFDLARQLDPLDPTPWLYSAMRSHAENQPVAAVRDFERSIALNENRAVHRSRLLLDEDLAARNASVGAAYADLGLRDVARAHAARSLALDPGNAAAHALLAESYRGLPRLGITRLSQRLQAQLLQRLTARPTTPSELIRERDPGGGLERFSTGANEYSALFEDRDPRFYAAGFLGGNSSRGGEAVHSRLLDTTSYSFGYYKFDTDGFRSDAEFDDETYNGFLQFAALDRLSLQFEARRIQKNQGDLRMELNGLQNQERRDLDYDLLRIGARFDVNDSSTLLLSLADAERDEFGERNTDDIFVTERIDERRARVAEVQLQHDRGTLQLTVGAGFREIDVDYKNTVTVFGFPLTPTSGSDTIQSSSAYLYANWSANEDLTWTLGLSYDDHDESDDGTPVEFSRLNPKLGIQWQITPKIGLRAARAATTKHQLVVEETIEPTQVAGFAQFYDDLNRSETDLYAAALDLRPADSIFGTVGYLKRKVEVVQSTAELEERSYHATFSMILADEWTASIGFERQRDETTTPSTFDLITETIPVSLAYHGSSGLFGRLNWTRFDQEKRRSGAENLGEVFDAVDLVAGYTWNRNRNRVAVGVDDLFDKVEIYQDNRHKTNDKLNVFRPFLPGRKFWASIKLAFD